MANLHGASRGKSPESPLSFQERRVQEVPVMLEAEPARLPHHLAFEEHTGRIERHHARYEPQDQMAVAIRSWVRFRKSIRVIAPLVP